MPLDRMPSISVGIIIPTGAVYDGSYHWPNEAGVVHASVRFHISCYSCSRIQGKPAALRKLAAALTPAADRANSAAIPAPAVVEGVAV